MTAGYLTRINRPTIGNGETEYWLSNGECLGAAATWDFPVYGNKGAYLAAFAYQSEGAAKAARQAMVPVSPEGVFIATKES